LPRFSFAVSSFVFAIFRLGLADFAFWSHFCSHFTRIFVFSHLRTLTYQALALVFPPDIMLNLKIPCRGLPKALSFSGCPKDLRSYFDDIINFCDGFGFSDRPEWIKFALKYAPFESADLWSHFISSSQGDWARFTLEITQQYPELDETSRSHANELASLKVGFASSEVVSMSSLGQYYCNFHQISLSLKNLLGPLPHLASMFKYGFPPEFG
ncbi:hypothetical protein M404DRAFT_943696, partial [Pisolithus tinctorius Marx 270]